MKIWQTEISLETATNRGKHTLSDFLGIEFIDLGDNYLRARMSITPRVHQPIGIMHGGVSCVLAETVGSTAANYCVDQQKYYCVGLDINTNHVRAIRDGYVVATAKPFHLGKTTQVWGIDIVNQDGKMISINRLTMAVLHR